MCHGADGAKGGRPRSVGCRSAEANRTPTLTAVITDGKPPKMPKYGDKLKPEEIKGLVAYIRTLKK